MIREFLKRSNDKAKFKSCFRAAELTRFKTVGNNKYEIFPTIHSINYNNPDYTEFVFTLPNGVNPKKISKNDFVFKQFFGRHIEIKGNLKKFVVRIYKKGSSKPIYVFAKYAENAKDSNGEKMKLPILCGDEVINGKPVLFDMTKRPHIMNCGETGGGKSTWLRAVITFLIEYLPPKRLDLYLCDLGKVEFTIFYGVKHIKVPIATDIDETIKIFDELQTELENRKDLMVKHEVTHVDDLPDPIPYKVCFVDEFHNLRRNDEAMDKLISIAAEGRKLGVFLVLTTQRPSKEVINGDLKANLTVSMAFKVKNKLNSNMILDAGAPNAAKLRGNGHGIVSIDDYYEIQSPLLEEDKARRILKAYKGFNEKVEVITESIKGEAKKDPDELEEEGPLDE